MIIFNKEANKMSKNIFKMLVDMFGVFRVWFFIKATRPLECINAAFLIGFGFFSLLNYYDYLALPSYRRFNILPAWGWGLVAAFGIVQLLAAVCKSNRSNQASGLIMIFSGCIWFFIAAVFSANGEAIVTAVSTYGVWAVAMLFTGYDILTINKVIAKKTALQL